MNDITYVGLGVQKTTVCVAVAENGRDGEVRHLGVFENHPDILSKARWWLISARVAVASVLL
jgi:hypothetical protein